MMIVAVKDKKMNVYTDPLVIKTDRECKNMIINMLSKNRDSMFYRWAEDFRLDEIGSIEDDGKVTNLEEKRTIVEFDDIKSEIDNQEKRA